MAKKKIILFDLDGTLIDSAQAIYESCCVACEQNKLKIPDFQSVRETIGYPLEDMFVSFGADRQNISFLVDSYRKYYHLICLQKTKLLPNATQSLQIAKKFAKLGVVTTKTAKYSKEILEHFEILNYFDVVIGIEDVKFPKPHQEPILRAIEQFNAGISSQNIFMVGDTPLDIYSAINAGVNPIALKSGYGKNEDLLRICQNVFEDALEAVNFIKTF
ncbi:HAD family hydrolase [Helicobacter sp. 11S03491-1]|uniref:HAD family hydrolase n=1 Tax=Helicobacter sp. 11S03491-1 TaxID=1476196 RepID=UPI000BD38950|nr:HAD family hydrolase [Helicobacter sp. 11S03491-1]PAF42648.1 hypothetical protein BKH45_03815 [Helicobacter sp. 11S03491-1]